MTGPHLEAKKEDGPVGGQEVELYNTFKGALPHVLQISPTYRYQT